MTNWQVTLVAVLALLELAIVWLQRWMTSNQPEYTVWVVLGAKVFKLLFAAISIIFVRYFTEIPLKEFCIWLIVCYILTIVVESILFLKKKK